MKKLAIVVTCFLLSGCWADQYVDPKPPRESRGLDAADEPGRATTVKNKTVTYTAQDSLLIDRTEDAYKKGVDDTIGEIKNSMRKKNAYGSYEAYVPIWRPPQVQKVWIRSRVLDGVMVPAHEEYVVIEDGGWVQYTDDGRVIRLDNLEGQGDETEKSGKE